MYHFIVQGIKYFPYMLFLLFIAQQALLRGMGGESLEECECQAWKSGNHSRSEPQPRAASAPQSQRVKCVGDAPQKLGVVCSTCAAPVSNDGADGPRGCRQTARLQMDHAAADRPHSCVSGVLSSSLGVIRRLLIL